MREYVLAPAVATLKTWQMEGKIEIFETDRADTPAIGSSGWSGTHRATGEFKRRPPPKRDPKAAAKFGQIAAVMFPMRDTHRLNISELNDVNHLLRHLTLGRTIFITRNTASFIADGKRDKILAVLPVSIMTPEEAVAHLSKEQAWPLNGKQGS
jgi:hypothetical protein